MSNISNAVQEKGEGLQAATTAMARVTLSSSTISPTTRAPIGMNDLLDELLDDIALFAEEADLPNLALIEQRWYAPARKLTWFNALGFKNLLAFADVLLERPQFATLVRHAELEGASSSTLETNPPPECSELASRTIGTIVQECPNLRCLHLGVPPRSASAQRQMLTPVGELRHLSSTILTRVHAVRSSAFLKAAPALESMERLEVDFNLNLETSGVLPPLPTSKAEDLTVCLYGGTLDAIETVCVALGSHALRFSIILLPLRDGADEQAQPAYRNRFNDIFRPFIGADLALLLRLGTDGRVPISRHLLDWPNRCGGVCIIVETLFPARCETVWCLGRPLACLMEVYYVQQKLQGAGRSRAWARRGDGWTISHAAGLKEILGDQVELVWE